MKLSKAQQAMFWREFKKFAAGSFAKDKTEENELRQKLIYAACGKASLTEINGGTDFDSVLNRMATLSGNKPMQQRTAVGTERRLYHLVKGNVETILRKGLGVHDSRCPEVSETDVRRYCMGILAQRGHVIPDASDWYLAQSKTTLLSLLKITGSAAARAGRRG